MSSLIDTIDLNKAIIKYLDRDYNYAYVQFANRNEQMAISANLSTQTVLMLEMRTKYFNASLLYEQFNTSTIKSLNNALKLLAQHIQIINEQLNSEIILNKMKYNYPNYSYEKHAFEVSFTISSSNKNTYYGTYLHPKLLAPLLLLINPKLAFIISDLIFTMLINEGVNEQYSLNNQLKDLIQATNESISHRQELIKSNNPSLIENDPTIDKIQVKKSKKVVRTKSQKHSSQNTKVDNRQSIIVVAHYDEYGEYSFGSTSYKLTAELVPYVDAEKYIQDLFVVPKLTEKELEQQLENGLIIKNSVIAKYLGLYNVPIDFLEQYVTLYKSDLDISINKNNYLITTDIETFKITFAEFVSEYMPK